VIGYRRINVVPLEDAMSHSQVMGGFEKQLRGIDRVHVGRLFEHRQKHGPEVLHD
jgi:hypothetical protein